MPENKLRTSCHIHASFTIPRITQAFERIINTPKRGIKESNIEQAFRCINDSKHVNIGDSHMLMQVCKDVTLKGAAKKELEQFIATIEHLNEFILPNNATPSRAIKRNCAHSWIQ